MSRNLLRKNLTNEARKLDLTQIKQKYDIEVKKFAEAKESFEEDHQRFITMKADMENMAQISREVL
jgi:hypothetical protein